MANKGNVSDIREFMTSWEGYPRAGMEAWATRRKELLLGTVKSTHYIPNSGLSIF